MIKSNNKLVGKVSVAEIESKYQELGTLQKVADYYGATIEAVRQFFIKNGLEYQKRRKYECDHGFFGRDTEESFYWAGFIAADGNKEKDCNRIKIELERSDKGHLEKFRVAAGTEAPIVDDEREETRPQFKQSTYYSSRIRVSSEQMANDLVRFGVVPAKSKIYAIPPEILQHQLVPHFIRGLIDGDGWIYCEGNVGNIGLCGTKECVESVFNTLRQNLGIERGNTDIREDGLCSMHFTDLESNTAIIHYLYDNCAVYLDRKKKVADEILLCEPRKIPIDRDVLWESYLRHNRDTQKVADELGCARLVVYRRLREFGFTDEINAMRELEPNNKLLSMIPKEQLMEDWNQLKSTASIANKYDVAVLTVDRAFEKLGIDHRVNNNVKAFITKDVLEQTYSRLQSTRQTATKLGISRSNVQYYMKKFGIKTL